MRCAENIPLHLQLNLILNSRLLAEPLRSGRQQAFFLIVDLLPECLRLQTFRVSEFHDLA